MIGTEKSSASFLEDIVGYAHSAPLLGADGVDGKYHPQFDTLHITADGVDWDDATFLEPLLLDQEYAEDRLDKSLDQVSHCHNERREETKCGDRDDLWTDGDADKSEHEEQKCRRPRR